MANLSATDYLFEKPLLVWSLSCFFRVQKCEAVASFIHLTQ